MSRRWLGLALLLSLGVNLGILGVLAVERLRPPEPTAVTEPPPEPARASTSREDPAEYGPPSEGGDVGPQGAGPRPPAGPPPAIAWRLERLADRLGLEGESRERFLEIQRDFFSGTFERRRRIVRLQEEFRRELAAPEPSEETVGELVLELSEARAALDRELARTVLRTRSLLGPERERDYLRFLARLGPGQGAGASGAPGRVQPGPRAGAQTRPGRRPPPGR
ncbi:MAG: periplasmic heavy metal sensor [Acidobacteriota bacterium]|jgi:hypothetical protein